MSKYQFPVCICVWECVYRSVCLHGRAVPEPYISSEQLVGHRSLWPALRVARISPFAVS